MNETKPTGIKEVFHRVKNNMQVISSLMELQLMESENSHAQAALREALGRMQVFVVIYQQLMPVEDFSIVDFERVASEIWRARTSNDETALRRAVFTNRIGALPLNVETAIPLALVLNELITRSMETHSADESREIAVEISEAGEGSFRLRYSDNSYPAAQEVLRLKGDETFGIRLITGLSRQIGGNAGMPGQHNGDFVISFTPRKKA